MESGDGGESDDELRRQIRITILHEYGHHFGLDEETLGGLGYG
jgi:predicted Zn-dependent protease with MMP-like domain